MLGWTGRGLQAGEATLAHWRPLQAALPARWPLTPDTQPGGGGAQEWPGLQTPSRQGASALHWSTHQQQWAINRHCLYAPHVCFRITKS